MTIENEDFIKVDYTETVDGIVISTTNKDLALENDLYDEKAEYGPQLIILGSGDLVEGFKEELIGKDVGDSGSVEVPPEKAFGMRDPNNVNLIPINKFKQEKPELGMRVSIEGKMGTITRVVGRKVRVDYNHPLADKTIKYDYSIAEKIEDRQEKLESLVSLFAKVDLEVKINDEDVAEINSPWELSYYKEWPMVKRGVAEMAMRLLDFKEVRYVEKHTLEPRVTSQVISPPSKPETSEDEAINAPGEEQVPESPETADERTE